MKNGGGSNGTNGSVVRCSSCSRPATATIGRRVFCTQCGCNEIARLRSRRRSAGEADLGALVYLVAAVVLAFTAHFVPPTPSTIHPLPAGQINYYAVAGSRASGLDASLILAVVRQESGGDPRATSVADARGLMQLEKSTAHDCGIIDRYDAMENILCGSRTLHYLIRRYGLAGGLESYNWGCGNVARVGAGHLKKMPLETQRYVVGVISLYDELQHLSLVVVAPPSPAPARRRSPRRLSHRTPMLQPQLPFFLAALFYRPATLKELI